MHQNRADFTLSFYYLSQLFISFTEQDRLLHSLFKDVEAIKDWLLKWRKRLNQEPVRDEVRQAKMQSVNPVYIPRNHLIEAAIRAAEDAADFTPFHDLYDVLQKPFELQAGKEKYRLVPKPNEVVEHTFCGT